MNAYEKRLQELAGVGAAKTYMRDARKMWKCQSDSNKYSSIISRMTLYPNDPYPMLAWLALWRDSTTRLTVNVRDVLSVYFSASDLQRWTDEGLIEVWQGARQVVFIY